MSHSQYADAVIPSPNHSGKRKYAITRLTPHHMAGVLSGAQCAGLFTSSARQASANYCIGRDGDVVVSVEEENRAWTSSSADNDNRAITFELSNDSTGGEWHVGDTTLNRFLDVAVDCVKRHNMPKMVVGDTLTWHRMFAATTCPGGYLLGRMQWIADQINSRAESGVPAQPAPAPDTTTGYTVVKGDSLWAIGQKLGVKWTEIATLNGLTSPYTIYVGQVLNVPGKAAAPSTPTYNVDTIAKEVIAGKWGNGNDRKNRLIAAGYDYDAVQARVNQMMSANANGTGATSSYKTLDQLASEVIQGKWGNDPQRSRALAQAGYDAAAIQKRVNQLM
jgi:LysM repeat protein